MLYSADASAEFPPGEDMNSWKLNRAGFFLLALLIFTLVSANVWSQSIVSGEVSGTLTDPSGAVVPGATVTLKNLDTGATQTASDQQYRCLSVCVSKAGQLPSQHPAVWIPAGSA
jgi:hypothetical protein